MPKDPLPHLPRPSDWDIRNWDTFSRGEVAEMFGGIDRSIISKDCVVLGMKPYRPIPRSQIWQIYILKCWQRLNPGCWRQSFAEEVERLGDKAFIDKYVHAQGGSRKDCEDMIDNWIAKKTTRKLFA